MMGLIFLLILATLAIGFALQRWLRIRYLGNFESISTASVAFNEAAFGRIINWDKNCFYIHGKPTWILSGEFHYWRVPDKDRWRSILLRYKAAGLNCIRIYFSWAFHSPDQGVYHFTGNRNVKYLMELCEELDLYVLAAPGPYICAETQAGGHPSWLVAMRNIRLRHSSTTMFRTFDPEYSKYCLEWFSAILPLLAPHQITVNPKGCLLGLQIENEAFETMKGIPIGLADDMRVLAKGARDLGITVPLFTNDAWEEGSFVPYPKNAKIGGKSLFGIDLYGFDKYVIFCPTSNPFTMPTENSKNIQRWTEWNPKEVIDAFKNTEKTVRKFGGGAAESPIFIPELQGGWFNHYTVNCTFDDVYDYYGDSFTRMVAETAISQGCTAFNIYMFYGGTNWGTLGDPDVYTSYDYSACIREFGHLSLKARKLRLSLLFAQSFSPEFLKTECNDTPSRSSFIIESSASNYIGKQRKSTGPFPVYFIFFRNFNHLKPLSSTISVSRYHREPVQLQCKLGYKESFIGIANYTTKNGLCLLLATMPIVLRTLSKEGHEIWIVQCDDQKNGQLSFIGGLELEGSLDPVSEVHDDVTILSFKKSTGWSKIQQKGDPTSALYIVALTGNDLMSVSAVFEKNGSNYPSHVFWGQYQFNFDLKTRELEVLKGVDSDVDSFTVFSNQSLNNNSPIPTMPSFISTVTLESTVEKNPAKDLPLIRFSETKRLDFGLLSWTAIPLLEKSTRPSKDPLDFCFTSGHVVYRLDFDVDSIPKDGLQFDITMRHRCSIILNQKSIGGHMTYSLSSLKPGAKQGPDVLGSWAGWKKYHLPSNELKVGKNSLYCIIESLGMNRAPGPVDDIRCSRGILDARIKGITGSLKWFISGVDVRKLDQVFNHSGFSDGAWRKSSDAVLDIVPKGTVIPSQFKCDFDWKLDAEAFVAPLRLFVDGSNTAYIYINNVMIGRYYGLGQTPQHDFYVPEHLLVSGKNALLLVTFGIGNECDLELEFRHWKFSCPDSALISGSGNISDKDGQPFVLSKHSCSI